MAIHEKARKMMRAIAIMVMMGRAILPMSSMAQLTVLPST